MTPGLADRPWEEFHEGMQVKLEARDGELYVLAQSEDRRRKENAMRRRRLKGLVHGLNRLKRTCRDRDRLIGKVAVLRKEAGRAARFMTIRLPRADEPVTRETFVCRLDRAAWREALARDGSYILRASIPWEDWPKGLDRQAPTLWAWYMQLVQVEEAFRTLKSDLGLRPIFHRVEPRVEAHILVAFLGYCLSATLRAKLRRSAPGLTAREARGTADDRRPGARVAAPYRAGRGAGDAPGETGPVASGPASAADPVRAAARTVGRRSPIGR
jgi:hypothetical protein